MVATLLARGDLLVQNTALRLTLVAGFLILAAVVAVVFPDTPDEILRIQTAYEIRKAGAYEFFFWPPGNVLTILANPLVGSDIIPDITAVRLLNLALAAIPLVLILWHLRNGLLMIVALLTAPYCFLVLSTASQQGLMIGFFAILIWAMATRRTWLFGLAALPLYLVNPAMIVVVPTALLVMAVLGRDGWSGRTFLIACSAYLPILATAFVIKEGGGDFLPTLAENGPLNIFLGNNPNPMAHRGVGDLASTVVSLGLDTDAGHLEVTRAWFLAEPGAFTHNLLTKLALFWMPWDYMRSGMGDGVSGIIFTYIGFVQIIIYTTFIVMVRRGMDLRLMGFAILLCLSAWLIYTIFFVKIRFRVPFDMMLLLTCLVTAIVSRKPGSPHA